MSFEAEALVTTVGKEKIAEMWAYGTSYMVKYWEASAGGHDPSDDTTALTPDPTATALSGPILFGPEPIDSIEWSSTICPKFVCRLEQGEFTGSLSSFGLIAEIVYVGPTHPAPVPVVGDTFLFAVCNRPKLNIASTDGPIIIKLIPKL